MFYTLEYRAEGEGRDPYWLAFTLRNRPTASDPRYLKDGLSEHIEAHPDATEDEAAQLEELKAWLLPQYEAGAHWVIETMEDEKLLLGLRQLGPAKLRADLKRFWKLQNERERACW